MRLPFLWRMAKRGNEIAGDAPVGGVWCMQRGMSQRRIQPALVFLLLRHGAAEALTQAVVDVAAQQQNSLDDLLLFDADNQPLHTLSHMAPLGTRCQQAARRAIADAGKVAPRLSLFPDPLHNVSVAARAHADDVRLAFFVLASRPSAILTVPRLVHALYDPSHLFLVHVDLKSNQSVHDELSAQFASDANVHVLRTRRLVQWGGFSMVSALLDSIASIVQRVDFDFLINLSDAEVALRTQDELTGFLRHHKDRVFMRVDAPSEEPPHPPTPPPQSPPPPPASARASDRRHAFGAASLRRTPIIECGGFGFVSVNTSFNDSSAQAAIGPACCVGQSGPLVHGSLPFDPPEPPPARSRAGATGGARRAVEHRGSQWAVLPHGFCKHMLEDPRALQWARVFERRILPDELYLPTVLMDSPYRAQLVNTNLRFEVWAQGGDAERLAYWATLPESEWGGARPLDGSSLTAALRSPMAFAKKALPDLDPTLLPRHDAWMGRKLAGGFDPRQPPLLAPMLRIDPGLHGFGAPETAGAEADEDGESGSGDEATGADDSSSSSSDAPTSPAAVLPLPRRVLRRRRVASVVFADGSGCSCAADCIPSPSSLADPPTEGDVSAPVAEGNEEDAAVAAEAQTRGCCAHLPDGRSAMCDPPVADAAASGGMAGEMDQEPSMDGTNEALALISDAYAAPTRPCPVATFDLTSSADGAPVIVLFVNRAPHPITVLHVDQGGLEVAALSLRVGEHAEVRARASYAWRARSRVGTLLLELARTPPSDAVTDAGDTATVHVHACG